MTIAGRPATGAARQARSVVTEEALLDAAMTLFHDRGYAATTIDDIAAAIGQTKGSFYFHFRTKEDCFLAVLARREELRRDWYRIPERLDPSTVSLDDVLRIGVAELAKSMANRPSFGLAMADFWLATADRPDARAAFTHIYNGWIREIAAFVARLQKGGWVERSLDADLVARQLFALVDGYQIHTRLYQADMVSGVFDGMRKLLQP